MKKPELQAILIDAMKEHRHGNFTRAENLYQEFLLHEPDRPDVLYNLALALISLNKIDTAISTLEKVLDRIPGHLDALNNLGALLLKNNQHEHALQCFSSVLAANPEHLEARNNLAAILLQLGHYSLAAKHYFYLLDKTPNDINTLYNSGIALLELENFEDAILVFEKVLILKPDYVDAIGNIGIAFLKLNNPEKAKEYFEKVLTKNPDHKEIRYLYSAITHQDIPAKPPTEYIENLFDHYAAHYEQHLTDTLHYHTPEALFNLLQTYIHFLPDHEWRILDLGCGTGLSGVPFTKISKTLVGIDLSAKMLNLAKHKAIYNNLIQEDILQFLTQNTDLYNLLLASDTFNYFGDLNLLLSRCHKALDTKGFLLFSLELLYDSEPWTLKPHGRYLHSKNYIEEIAKENHFKIIAIENTALRVQNHNPVKGLLCLFQR
jgi:predicted TPR repeat methyltransferase